MTDIKAGAIEVWLRQPNLNITCTIVHDDETTKESTISALSMRGAQREITGDLINAGYTPAGRWEGTIRNDTNGWAETTRRFKPAP